MGLISRVSSRTYRECLSLVTMLRRGITNISRRSAVTLPPLKYEYQDLEPFINAEIMELHHSKHHQTYTNNFNNLSAQIQEAVNSGDFTTQQKLQAGMKFNYGGYVNHCLFFDNLCPNAEKQPDPTGAFQAQIDKDFGSFENFKNELSTKSIAYGKRLGLVRMERKGTAIADCHRYEPR